MKKLETVVWNLGQIWRRNFRIFNLIYHLIPSSLHLWRSDLQSHQKRTNNF